MPPSSWANVPLYSGLSLASLLCRICCLSVHLPGCCAVGRAGLILESLFLGILPIKNNQAIILKQNFKREDPCPQTALDGGESVAVCKPVLGTFTKTSNFQLQQANVSREDHSCFRVSGAAEARSAAPACLPGVSFHSASVDFDLQRTEEPRDAGRDKHLQPGQSLRPVSAFGLCLPFITKKWLLFCFSCG